MKTPRPRVVAPRAVTLGAAAALLIAGATAPASLAVAATSPGAGGPVSTSHEDGASGSGHTPEHPLALAKKKQAQLDTVVQKRVKGDKAAQGKVVKVGKGQYVKLEREGEDRIFVVLAEFGNERYPDPRFADAPTPPLYGNIPQRFDGPLHNQIPQPNRADDNSTLWQPDYNRAHYVDMYFNRMAKYYETQSSGRYSVSGDVTEWVKVPFNQALYGRNYCGTASAPATVCASTKALVRDALAIWVDNQLRSGKSMAEVTAYLKTFDKQDRYDLDGDGNFDEPDGFIDHFQIVHAGGDEAAGDPTYGGDAIWSHRWYSNLQAGGPGGLTGVNVGSNKGTLSSTLVPNNPTGVWVGDYTIQPENGGLGVFAHEFGHDLGLPDLYDTSGNVGGAENSTAFWSLMSSGANIGDGGPNGIGDSPTDLSAWELLRLGWLNAQGNSGPFYEIAKAGEKSNHQLGPNVPATKKPQAVIVSLPDKEVPMTIGTPAQGTHMFWSTKGDDLNTSMTKTGITGTQLTAKVNYSIETGWDYAFLEASSNGTTWTPVVTNRSFTGADSSGVNTSGAGISGNSGGWVDLTATLPAGTTAIRFRYQTDGAEAWNGFMVDAVAIDGTMIGSADTDEGWTLDGFIRTTGAEVQKFFNAYVLENRQYDGYDTSLWTAYNFGWTNSRPDWVETYPYQDGMLVWYWNDQYSDNNVGQHPGSGLLLPVDAHPQFSHWPDGTLMRPRILAYDSTFTPEATDPITLHLGGVPGSIASKPGVSVFDDTQTWWYNSDEHGATGSHPGRYQPGWYSVDVPKTGTSVTVKGASKAHLNITVAPVR